MCITGARRGTESFFPLVLLFSRFFASLMAAFVLRGLKELGEPTRKSLITDLAPETCKAGLVGLYDLIRDVGVSLAAFGGAFVCLLSPETNRVTAFVSGIIGAAGFAVYGRDIPLPVSNKEVHNDTSQPTP